MKDALLKLENVSVNFSLRSRSFRVLDGVSFFLKRGEVLALVGESGSGKTITAFAILRLLPEGARQGGGEVFFKGVNLTELPEKEMRHYRGKEIGMVFQEPGAALNPVFTIGYQISEPLIIHYNIKRSEAKERAKEVMKQVGLSPDLYSAYPHMLSGGQRQRAVIAAAISADPSLLIADEPTTALDVTVEAQIMDLFMKLREERGLSILFISHDITLVGEIADRIAIMYAGKLQEIGPAHEVIEAPIHPYTQGLMNSIPRPGMRRLNQIPGNVPPLWAIPSGCKFHTRCVEKIKKCEEEEPPLVEVESGRWVRCWRRM